VRAGLGNPALSDRRIAVLGLGHVGGRLTRRLAEAGAELLVADVDPDKRALADALGADPDRAATRVLAIGDTLRDVYAAAEDDGVTPLAAAQALARRRLEAA
jgi:nucleoside-diphosphate-sugar epimerase